MLKDRLAIHLELFLTSPNTLSEGELLCQTTLNWIIELSLCIGVMQLKIHINSACEATYIVRQSREGITLD